MRFCFVLTKQTDGTTEECAGDITDEDWALFVDFRNFATALESAEWYQAGLDAGFTVNFQRGHGLQVTVPNQPSNASVRELLHLLRPFLLKQERTWYANVASRMWRYFEHPYLRQVLARSRRIFDDGQFSLYGQITVNDVQLNDDRTFGLWLNAFEYHRDAAKRTELLAAFGGPPDDLTLAVFRGMIADKTIEVLRLAAFVSRIEDAHVRRSAV